MNAHRLLESALLVLLLGAPLASEAFTPESGLYFIKTSDATGSGTGLAIDIQNEFLFAAGYVFTSSGSPTYVTIQGKMTLQSDGSWGLSDPAGLFTYAGGQCIGSKTSCPYKSPKGTSIGGFTINFAAENIGTLTWGPAGNSASVTMIRTGFSGGDNPSSLLGEWDIVFDRQGAAIGDGLQFEGDKLKVSKVQALAGSSTDKLFTGCVPNGEDDPDCGSAQFAHAVSGTYKSCTGFCAPTYQLAAFTNNILPPAKIVRVYTFTENGLGGQFTGTFRGTVNLCPAGVATVDACTANPNIPFVAYRSGSAGYAVNGKGMD